MARGKRRKRGRVPDDPEVRRALMVRLVRVLFRARLHLSRKLAAEYFERNPQPRWEPNRPPWADWTWVIGGVRYWSTRFGPPPPGMYGMPPPDSPPPSAAESTAETEQQRIKDDQAEARREGFRRTGWLWSRIQQERAEQRAGAGYRESDGTWVSARRAYEPLPGMSGTPPELRVEMAAQQNGGDAVGFQPHQNSWLAIAGPLLAVGVGGVVALLIAAVTAPISPWGRPWFVLVFCVCILFSGVGAYGCVAPLAHWPLPEPRQATRRGWRVGSVLAFVALALAVGIAAYKSFHAIGNAPLNGAAAIRVVGTRHLARKVPNGHAVSVEVQLVNDGPAFSYRSYAASQGVPLADYNTQAVYLRNLASELLERKSSIQIPRFTFEHSESNAMSKSVYITPSVLTDEQYSGYVKGTYLYLYVGQIEPDEGRPFGFCGVVEGDFASSFDCPADVLEVLSK